MKKLKSKILLFITTIISFYLSGQNSLSLDLECAGNLADDFEIHVFKINSKLLSCKLGGTSLNIGEGVSSVSVKKGQCYIIDGFEEALIITLNLS
jgi:hypothetical protein